MSEGQIAKSSARPTDPRNTEQSQFNGGARAIQSID